MTHLITYMYTSIPSL